MVKIEKSVLRDLGEAVIQVMVAAHLPRRLDPDRPGDDWRHVVAMLFAGALPVLARAGDIATWNDTAPRSSA